MSSRLDRVVLKNLLGFATLLRRVGAIVNGVALSAGILFSTATPAVGATRLDLVCPEEPVRQDDEVFVAILLTRDDTGVSVTRSDLSFESEFLEFMPGSVSAGAACDAIDGQASCVENPVGELRCQCFSTNPAFVGDSMPDGEVMTVGFRVKSCLGEGLPIGNAPSASTNDIPPLAVNPIEGAGCQMGCAGPDVGASLFPINPCRVLDTRSDGSGLPLAAGGTRHLSVKDIGSISGRCAPGVIPEDARAICYNLTAVRPSSNGFLTLFPFGAQRPPVSSINFQANAVIGNGGVVAIASGSPDLSIYLQAAVPNATAHATLDATCYFR